MCWRTCCFPVKPRSPSTRKTFYLDRYPTFFACVLILDVLSVVHNVTIEHLPVTSQAVHLVLLVTLGSVLISRTRKESIHLAVALFLLAILVTTLVFTQDTLLVGD